MCAEPEHSLCAPLGERLVGTVLEATSSSVVIRVEEVHDDPDYGSDPRLRVGDVAGTRPPGSHRHDRYAWPSVAVGDRAWLIQYVPRYPANESECPAWTACREGCALTDNACHTACNQTDFGCGPGTDAARRDGTTVLLGVERGGIVDLGTDYLGPLDVPLAEVPSIDTYAECVAVLPIPSDAVYVPTPTGECYQPVYSRVDPWDP